MRRRRLFDEFESESAALDTYETFLTIRKMIELAINVPIVTVKCKEVAKGVYKAIRLGVVEFNTKFSFDG